MLNRLAGSDVRRTLQVLRTSPDFFPVVEQERSKGINFGNLRFPKDSPLGIVRPFGPHVNGACRRLKENGFCIVRSETAPGHRREICEDTAARLRAIIRILHRLSFYYRLWENTIDTNQKKLAKDLAKLVVSTMPACRRQSAAACRRRQPAPGISCGLRDFGPRWDCTPSVRP